MGDAPEKKARLEPTDEVRVKQEPADEVRVKQEPADEVRVKQEPTDEVRANPNDQPANNGQLAADEVVKVEHRFCVVCQDTVQGEVAICPKSEHWVCAAHLKERSFDKCPLCKTRWLVAQDHDLEKKENPKDSLMLKLMRPSTLTVEEMLAKFRQSRREFWRDWTSAIHDSGSDIDPFTEIQRLVVSCDRNFAFFTTVWEETVTCDRYSFYCELNSALSWMHTLMASEQFLTWFLPRYGEAMLAMCAMFRSVEKMQRAFQKTNVGASRAMIEYSRARNFDPFAGRSPVTWIPTWLRKGLENAQQMCELVGVPITPVSIVNAIPFTDAAVLHFARVHYPDIGRELFEKITGWDGPQYGRRETAWEDYSDAFHAELMELKPRGWIYTGKSPKFKDFRPIYVFDSIAMKRFKCAWIDWQQQGMQAPMTEERYASWASKEMVIAPEGKAEPMVVKFLYLITFEKHGTTRLYATDEPVDRTNVTKVRASLENKRIQPPLGTMIRYEDLSVWTLEKSHVF